MKRRSFLQTMGAAAGMAALGVHGAAAPATMSLRKLGRLDWQVSVVPYSGLALREDSQTDCNASVKAAYDGGVNYFDNAPAYAKGVCQQKMGIALKGIDRSSYHLACKTKRRDAEGARLEMEDSFQKLRTDYFDVYQLHHLVKPEDVEQALGPGGAMETILKAKEEGKVRAIGFSAHTTRAALLAMEKFRFDTVMFPVNYVEYFNLGFGKEVLALAEKQGAAVLSIKTMSAGAWPQNVERTRKWWYRTLETQEDINRAYRWTLALPGVVMGFCPSWLDLHAMAVKAGQSLQDVGPEDEPKLRKLALNCGSIFKREHDRAGVASVEDPAGRFYPDHLDRPCIHRA